MVSLHSFGVLCEDVLCRNYKERGDRYLTGQAILKNHKVHGDWFSEMMYFADEKIGGNEHHWVPISDSSSIDEFCNAFGVSRNEHEPGTSMVIVLPKKELDSVNLKQCLLSNYCVPIMSGKLQIEISSEEGDVEVITHENVREVISELDWTIPRSMDSAWTTSERMEELVDLYDAIEGFGCPDPIKLGKPIKNKKTDTAEQFEEYCQKGVLLIYKKSHKIFLQPKLLCSQGKFRSSQRWKRCKRWHIFSGTKKV